jgi:hypothetical protein
MDSAPWAANSRTNGSSIENKQHTFTPKYYSRWQFTISKTNEKQNPPKQTVNISHWPRTRKTKVNYLVQKRLRLSCDARLGGLFVVLGQNVYHTREHFRRTEIFNFSRSEFRRTEFFEPQS